MRPVDPFVLRIAGAMLCVAGFVIACSSSSDDSSSGGSPDGGDTLADGAAGGDGATGTDAAPPPTPCKAAADCPSGVCNLATMLCSAATCSDSVKNGTETDIDCGGSCATKCDVAKACAVPADCTSSVCTGDKCQAPTNTDGVKNGNETGIDCGGAGNPTCADGQGCVARTDCTNSYCKAGICTAPKPDDGVQDGDETDVDCGGTSGSKACADGKMCKVPADCTSLVCTGGICQVPSPTDMVKNGDETDIDCGGAAAPGCAAGKVCLVAGDCASSGCNYNKVCTRGKSCTAHYGGDTCGLGGAGGKGAAAWEDCCGTIDVPSSSPDAVGGTVHLEKYPVTSGRMRVFLESIGYDVRTWVQTARAAGQIPKIPVKTNNVNDNVNSSLDATWDVFLPTSFDGNTNADEIADCDQGFWDYHYKACCETLADTKGACPAGTTYFNDGNGDTRDCHYYDSAQAAGIQSACPAGHDGKYAGTYTAVKRHLGGTIFRANSQTETGCYAGSPGTHSFRFPDGDQDSFAVAPEQPQEVYDTKTQNCVDYVMGQAFCAWDGGRLETFKEWQTAYTNQPLAPDDKAFYPQYTPWAPGDARVPFAVNSASYYGCRFPTATDASHGACGLSWNTTTQSIELADWKYSYEYPNLTSVDYIVFLTPPGRTTGRGPYGHSDLLGAGFELNSSVNFSAYNSAATAVPNNTGPFTATHHWSGNGSWEVHNYDEVYGGATMLLNKYGKLGLRCVKLTDD